MPFTWMEEHRAGLRVLAVLLPTALCGTAYLLRGPLSPEGVALLLVLVVVAAAATGDRWAGLLASLASAASFDFFLTEPFLDLQITNPEDIELAVVLLLVALAVSELALWGARQRALAGRRAGYVEGVIAIADLSAAGATQAETAEAVAVEIRRVLGVEAVVFVLGPPDAESAILARDGTLSVGDLKLDMADGLPTDRFSAIPVVLADGGPGHFRVAAAASLVNATAEQLRVVVLLADQFTASERRPR